MNVGTSTGTGTGVSVCMSEGNDTIKTVGTHAAKQQRTDSAPFTPGRGGDGDGDGDGVDNEAAAASAVEGEDEEDGEGDEGDEGDGGEKPRRPNSHSDVDASEEASPTSVATASLSTPEPAKPPAAIGSVVGPAPAGAELVADKPVVGLAVEVARGGGTGGSANDESVESEPAQCAIM